ncbi:type 1 glutamine amidotransferase [Xylocopilactobacillus apicola]|uniref:Glutamine amidotransferase n=1 Tax=Xylocopilactobacillus apicola TaxID=2932184 RepID=A0AAU9D226_9LACO|nr:type 1 glutamine amidotransferase [Xylocopilactobacillus apicola]BDR58806.1 glutamine amidotransferase [Xylocopilactobacillus apicola]
MIINVLQHAPNEGPGSIQKWAQMHHYDFYVYHPAQFGILPEAKETDFLVILGSPMSPNDREPWIEKERTLIKELIAANKPIFGVCFGAQQIVKTLGYRVLKAPVKEVGWAPVNLMSNLIPGLPEQLNVLHWHEEMFEIPRAAKLLYSSEHVTNQGFILPSNIVGLQFHLEPLKENVNEIVVNDAAYLTGSVLNQNPKEVLENAIPAANQEAMFKILDFICKKKAKSN